MAHSRFTARDLGYLNCTSFEVYIAVGLVFVLGFTLMFILSVVAHVEVLLWPGTLLVLVASFFVYRVLKRREYAAKLREIEADYAKE